MEKYFKTSLEALKTKEYKDVHIFLGNQSGDLDSAVSSLTYAMFSFWKYNHTKSKEENNVKDDKSKKENNVKDDKSKEEKNVKDDKSKEENNVKDDKSKEENNVKDDKSKEENNVKGDKSKENNVKGDKSKKKKDVKGDKSKEENNVKDDKSKEENNVKENKSKEEKNVKDDKSKEENNVKDDIFVAVYNIDRSEYKNKTEVVFCFKEHGINENNLVFRDEIDLEAIAKESTLKVTMVDHYQLAPNDQFLKDHVKEIVDHRPTYSTDFDKQVVEWKVRTVASCCTNILDAIRELSWPLKPYYALKYPAFFEEYEMCAELLHCTILLDTANLSQELKRTTDEDLEALEFLEGIIKPNDIMAERKVKFEKLMEARADVSSMEPDVLITKDLKIVGDILMPSLPILVQNFLKHPNAIEAVQKTMVSKGCTISVLLGTSLIGTVKKDVLIYTSDSKSRAKKLTEFLLGYTTKNFGLEFDPTHSTVEHSFYYHQRNLQVSRKDYTYCINHFLECTSTAGIQNEC